MTVAETVRRVLTDAPGEALCDACLALACATDLAEMRRITGRLLAEKSFGRRAVCARCGRVVATIVRLASCAHCRQAIGPAEHPSRFGGDVVHASCLRILLTDDATRTPENRPRRPRHPGQNARSRNGAPTAIAIVDDDPSVRRGLGRLLAAAGYQVITYASGREFLDGLAGELPSCLVLDVRMPGMSGVAVHDALKAAGRSLPVLFISGDADLPEPIRASIGASLAYLAKPVDDDQLFATVHRLIAAAEDRAVSC